MIRHTHTARAATVPVTTFTAIVVVPTVPATIVQRRRRPAHGKRVSCNDHRSFLKKMVDSRVNRVVVGSWATSCPHPGGRVGLALVVALVVVLFVVLVVVLLRRRGVAVLPPIPDDGHLLVVEILVVLVTVLLLLLGNAGTALLCGMKLMHGLYWTHFCAFSVRPPHPCIVLSARIRAIGVPTLLPTLILWLFRRASFLRLAASVPPVPTLVSAAHSIRGAISPPARALPPPPRCYAYCSARALWCTHAFFRSVAAAPITRVAATALIVHAPVSPAAAARPRAPVGSHHRFPFPGSSGIPVKAGLGHSACSYEVELRK
jgi:hypothetical protein